MRALKIAGAAVAALIVVAVLLLLIGVPSDFMTSAVQSRVERETGYRLTIAGTTKIGVWPSLNVTLNDVTLQDPKDRDTSNRLTVGSIQADMTLASVWSGHPHITELVIARPVLSVPLLRERTAPRVSSSNAAAPSGEADTNAVSIDRVKITDGTIVFSNLRDRVENRIEGISADALIGADRNVKVTGSAHAGEHPLKFDIKATVPAPPIERQNIPLELTLEAPNLLQSPLSSKAEVRLNGSVVMINGITGTLGDGAFNGWASVDIASKPLVKLDLDFQRLDVATASTPAGSPSQPWSNASIDLAGLNYVDLQARISADQLSIGSTHVAPVATEATLASGVLKCRFANLGAYGGQANGDLIIDASGSNPSFTLRSDLAGIRALPLLQSAADFDKLDGKLQAKLALRSSGASQRAIMSNLDGTAFVVFQDGAIRGINVAQMIRSLTSGTLSGWQEGKEQATDLTQLSASFHIEKGQATSSDLNLVGPLVRVTGAGTVDLGEKSLAFRVEPKLVMTTEGQGRTSDPVGLGIPVVIDGPWAQPRIYPDMAGVLDNPDAAYAKLKEMGKGLFGSDGALNGLGGMLGGNGSATNGSAGGNDQLGGNLGQTLGTMIQQGLRQSRTISPASPAPGEPSAPAPGNPPPPPSQDSQPMNDVLKQLFNR
ncbi:AsmA family protein [Bradyrhizobium canariense]|uniref:AsmA protein n=1 Tax=Bradyrhizobium canariense TaxID=255045 RepID=A0A1H1YLS0_9BRAD|nr:AsmA family protein [Bradyrhizobium canariense]SDT22407.1 AsmA protein [Bradyrhizobium canariense]